MFIQAFPSGPFATNTYVIFSKESDEAFLIDPAQGSFFPVLEFLNKFSLKLIAILLTHSHWDHIADASLFVDQSKIPLIVHSLDAPNLISPGSDGLPLIIKIKGVKPTRYFEEGEKLKIGDQEFEVIFTPGHSPGCVCFYDFKNQILFSGDTLFKGSIGNLSFPSSVPHLMRASLEKLANLPDNVKVYPGHGPSTTMNHERKTLEYYIKSL